MIGHRLGLFWLSGVRSSGREGVWSFVSQAPGQWGFFKDGLRLDHETESWDLHWTLSSSEAAVPSSVKVANYLGNVSLRVLGKPLWRDPAWEESQSRDQSHQESHVLVTLSNHLAPLLEGDILLALQK